MTPTRPVLVFYSPGPHFSKAVASARERFPGARCIAIVPPGFAASHAADEVRVRPGLLPLTPFLRGFGAAAMVVMFASPKLRVLAALSGAQDIVHVGPDGRARPLPRSLWRNLAIILHEKLRGHLTYGWIWLYIRLFPVRKKDV